MPPPPSPFTLPSSPVPSFDPPTPTVPPKHSLLARGSTVFVGADGLAYEVKGEAGRAFNIISSPSVSVNAEFQQVLPGLGRADVAETVMGNVEMAVCGHFGVAKLLLNASDGGLRLSFHPGPIPTGLASLSTEKIMAAVGVKLVEERYTCNLKRMACEWTPSNELPLTLHPPHVDMRYSRVKLRHANIQVGVTRNARVDLGGSHGRPQSTVDCADFSAWEMAKKACTALLQGLAPKSKKHEWLLMLLMPTLPREQQFFFTHIETPYIRYLQRQVHGLMGQRAVEPAFTWPIDPGARAAAASRDALFTDRSPTASIGENDDPQRSVRHDPATEVGVGQTAASIVAERFGPQGEGAIIGHYSDYMVSSISEHDRFKYSRFACAAGRSIVL